MADLALKWNPATGYADWAVGNGDLVSGSTLETAVIRSLFTDKRLPAGTAPTDGTGDPRGWWGDTYNGYQIGSLLWTLERSKKTNGTALLRTAEKYATDALQWLIDSGVVATATAAASWANATNIVLAVTLQEPNAPTPQRFVYSYVWNGG
jgi:phage gp46-like protein